MRLDDRLSELWEAWALPRVPLSGWVRQVGRAFQGSQARVEVASAAVRATQAEFESVIRLDALDDEALHLISEASPPMTTWMLLAEMGKSEIAEALAQLTDRREATAFDTVRTSVQVLSGATPIERVTVLPPLALSHAVKKAEQYLPWPKASKNYKALKDFARRRRSGQTLTPKQAAWALNILIELQATKVLQVPSPDGDDELVQALIDATG